MEKMKVVIAGEKVHGIGYRYFLMEAALNSGIEHFRAVNVLNHKQEVHVFVAGEKDQLQEFYEFVSTNFPEDAKVREVKRHDYKGYIPKIDSFALVFNVGQMRTFIEVGKSLEGKIDISLEKQDAMLEKQDQMLEKQDEMLSKQEEHIELTKEIVYETKHISAKQEELIDIAIKSGEKLDSISRAEIEIKKLREEFQELKEAIRKAGIEV